MDALKVSTRRRPGFDSLREGVQKHLQAALRLRMMFRRGVQTDEIGMHHEIDRTALRFASQPEAAVA